MPKPETTLTSAEAVLATIGPFLKAALAREKTSKINITALYKKCYNVEPKPAWIEHYKKQKWIGPLQTADLLIFTTFVAVDFINLEIKVDEGIVRWSIMSMLNGEEKTIEV